MLRMSRVVSFLVAATLIVGIVGSNFELAAQDKKDKKDKKDETKDKKEVKKEEKKEPFKPDMPSQEFSYIVKGEKDETGKTYWVTGVAFGADGKTVAAVYRDNTIKVWDLAAKKESLSIKAPTMKGLGEYRGLLYANAHLYVGTGQLIKAPKVKDDVKDKAKDKAKEPVKERPIRIGEIKIFDAKTGKPGPALIGHLFNIDALAISKDGKELASGSDDGTAKIWSIAAGKDTQTLKVKDDAKDKDKAKEKDKGAPTPLPAWRLAPTASNSLPPAPTTPSVSGTSPAARKSLSSRSSARSRSRTPRGR